VAVEASICTQEAIKTIMKLCERGWRTLASREDAHGASKRASRQEKEQRMRHRVCYARAAANASQHVCADPALKAYTTILQY